MKKVHGSNPYNNNLNYSNPDYSFSENGLGTFQNVFLTETEIMDLKEILLNNYENYIERLSTYIKSTGKQYKDHKATILTWFYKDQVSNKQKNKVTTYSLEDYEIGEYL